MSDSKGIEIRSHMLVLSGAPAIHEKDVNGLSKTDQSHWFGVLTAQSCNLYTLG